jgi:hypoxanthine phosphoribosyltransferase
MREDPRDRTQTFETALPPDNGEGEDGAPPLEQMDDDLDTYSADDLAPFVHPAEADFASFLDFYRIRWQYEPRSFPLRWRDGRVAEMFTPDFYLPEQDLFVELTTMKQSLVTRKNRKIRRLRELYPNVNVVLVNRKAFHELLARFGYGSIDITSLRPDDIERILLSSAEIQARVEELGHEISEDYAGKSLVLVGLLKGITFFLADLARAITRPLAIDYLSVANPAMSPDGIHLERHLDIDITGRHVLLVEDIVNTGLTMDFVLRHLQSHDPATLEVCALLDKSERRIAPVDVRYIGFNIPNDYVVGYGLDHRELYRNLPFICVLKRSAYEDEVPVAGDLAGVTAKTGT